MAVAVFAIGAVLGLVLGGVALLVDAGWAVAIAAFALCGTVVPLAVVLKQAQSKPAPRDETAARTQAASKGASGRRDGGINGP